MDSRKQRYVVRMPDGMTVYAEITPDMLAIAERVRVAMASGKEPDVDDLDRLMRWADTGRDHAP